MTRRIAIAGFYHETNTFAAQETSWQDFEAYQFAAGAEMIDRYGNTGTELGGMIQAAHRRGWQLVPLLFAAAVPSGRITGDCFQRICAELAEGLARTKTEALLLVLHGAAVAEDSSDADGILLQRLRAVLGPDRPIVATTDFHANLSRLMVDHADAIIGYDSFPHIDMKERGAEAVAVLSALLEGKMLFEAFRSLPLVTVPQRQGSGDPPLDSIFAKLHSLEDAGRISCGTLAMGFPYAESDKIGASVLCYGNKAAATEAAANELAALLWNHRDDFDPDLTPLANLPHCLSGLEGGPIVLVDPADNIGGGSAGDGTAVLTTLLESRISGAVLVINDPAAARTAGSAGIGGVFRGPVGAKVDKSHGSPVALEGTVQFCGDVSYRHSGSYMTGFVTSMGYCALIEAAGNKILLTSQRTMPFDIEQLRALGIEPAEERILVVKSATAWRAAYGPIAAHTLYLDTPGVCPSNLHRLPYRDRRRPLYPLDQITDRPL